MHRKPAGPQVTAPASEAIRPARYPGSREHLRMRASSVGRASRATTVWQTHSPGAARLLRSRAAKTKHL